MPAEGPANTPHQTSQNEGSRRRRYGARRLVASIIGVGSLIGVALASLVGSAGAADVLVPSSVTMEQWAVDSDSWVTGNLGAGYVEGQVVPFRMTVTDAGNTPAGETDVFYICRDYFNGTDFGYLFLDEYDTTINAGNPPAPDLEGATASAPVDNITAAGTGATVVVNNVVELGAQGVCNAGQRETKVELTISGIDAPGDQVYVLWGGHFASPFDPGVTSGAGNFNALKMRTIPDKSLAANVDAIPTGTIVIEKDTVPDNAQNFTFTPTGFGFNGGATFDLDDDADLTLPNSQTFTVPAGGPYTITEAAVTGWTQTSAVCDSDETVGSIDVDADETVTCTFTNTQDATVTVTKITDPASSTQSFDFDLTGADLPADLDLDTDAVSATPSSATFTITGNDLGAKTITESATTGWTLTDLTCVGGGANTSDTGSTASLGVDAGENIVCTFTNTQNATVTVTKITDPVSSTQSFDFDLTGSGVPADLDLDTDGGNADRPSSQSFTLTAAQLGEVTITESATAGWTLTSLDCTPDLDFTQDGAKATLDVDAGENIVCTFTNTQGASLVIDKVTDPAGSPTVFEFDVEDSEGDDVPGGIFTATDATNETIGGLAAGTYSIEELAEAGWIQGAVSCSDDSPNTAIVLSAGETVTCTFRNTQQATVTVTKVTVPAGDNTDFAFTSGIANLANFNLDGNAVGDLVSNTTGPVVVAPGQYVITEAAAPANWALTSVVCNEGTGNAANGTASITVDAGDAISCVFTNTFTEPEPECPEDEEGLRGAFNRGGDDCPDEDDDDDYDEEADEDDAEEDALDDDPLEDAGEPVDVGGNTDTNNPPVISPQTEVQNPAPAADPALSPAGDSPLPLQQLPRTGSSVNLMKQAMLALLLVIIGVPAMVFGRRRPSAQA